MLKLSGRFLVLLVVIVLLGALVPAASADTRCGGQPGLQAYDGTYLTGSTIRLCSDDRNQIRIANLTLLGWNDRISSIQSFNFPAGFAACLYENKDYNVPDGGDRKQLLNNNTWDTLGSMNNRTTSIKYTASCP